VFAEIIHEEPKEQKRIQNKKMNPFKSGRLGVANFINMIIKFIHFIHRINFAAFENRYIA
jgi:hypothetical protein